MSNGVVSPGGWLSTQAERFVRVVHIAEPLLIRSIVIVFDPAVSYISGRLDIVRLYTRLQPVYGMVALPEIVVMLGPVKLVHVRGTLSLVVATGMRAPRSVIQAGYATLSVSVGTPGVPVQVRL